MKYALLEKISKLFFYYEDDKPSSASVKEDRATIHTPGAPVSAWAHKLFGFVPDETFEESEAFCSTLVWRAIKVLSEPMASMTLDILEKKENGDVVKVKDHPLDYLLNIEPSKYYSAYTWRDTQMHHLGLRGNSYNRIIYKGNGDVDQIIMIDPAKVNDIFLQNNEVLYKVDGIDKMLPGSQVLHFMWSSFNGFVGKNPVECFKDTFILDRESRDYGKNFYQNGAFLSGVLHGPTAMSEPAYRRLKNSWQDSYGGAGKAGTTAILEEGFKFDPIRLDPVSAAWIETRRMLAIEVARIFGVPPHMLMDLEKATFSNIEHQSLGFVKYSLTPWVRRWEDELNRKLFPRNSKLCVRFNMNELLRGDMQSMVTYLTTNQINGNLSINEVRRDFLQKPGIEGGDNHLVQGNNMIPVTDLGKQLQLPLTDEANI